MNKSIVGISKDKYIYQGMEYDHEDFFSNIKLCKNIKIIIFDEDLFIRKFNIMNNCVADKVDLVVQETFANKEEYLINYLKSRDKKYLYIYAVKGGVRVNKLSEKANKLKVIPLQIFVMKKINKKYRLKSYQCIFKYREVYYYYNCENEILEISMVEGELELFKENVKKVLDEKEIYLDNRVNISNLDLKVIKFDLKEFINEKIYNK